MGSAQGMEIAPAIKLSTILTATVFSCAVGIFFLNISAREGGKTESYRGASAQLSQIRTDSSI